MATVTDEKPLTGVRKRQQIADANKQMLIWVAIAAIVVSVCAVLSWNFVQRIIYQAKVNGRIGDTAKVLSNNIDEIEDLMTEVNKLSTNKNLNLPNLRTDDSTAFQVVLDALPTEDDRTALGASLQDKVLAPSGVTIDQIAVTTTGGTATVAATSGAETDAVSEGNRPTAQPITFNIVLRGNFSLPQINIKDIILNSEFNKLHNFGTIHTAIKDIERTIRPIIIDSIDLQGTGDQLQATITATTYYVPKVNYTLGSEEVEP